MLLFTTLYSAYFFALVLGAEYDMTIEVEAGKTECYYQPVLDSSHVAMEVDYQVKFLSKKTFNKSKTYPHNFFAGY